MFGCNNIRSSLCDAVEDSRKDSICCGRGADTCYCVNARGPGRSMIVVK